MDFADILGITSGGILLGLGIILTLMNIPFGKGMLNFIAFVLIGSHARRILRVLCAIATEEVKQYTSVVLYGVEVDIHTAVYYTIVGIGFFVTIYAYSRRSTMDMLHAAIGYMAGFAVDIASYQSFLMTLGDSLGKLLLYDLFMQLMDYASEGMEKLISDLTNSLFVATATSWIPIVGDFALAVALAVVSVVSFTLLRLEATLRSYLSRLYSGIMNFLSAVGDGTILLILAVVVSDLVASVMVTAMSIVYVPMIGLWIWSGLSSFILYLKKFVNLAIVTIIAAAVGGAVGGMLRRLAGGFLAAVGGRVFRESSVSIAGALGTIIAIAVAYQAAYPFLLASATALSLANTYYAARLTMGIPRRRLQRYVAPVFSILLYSIAMKYLAPDIADAIIYYLDNIQIPLGIVNIKLTDVVAEFPVVGQVIDTLRTAAENLLRIKQVDP